VSKLSQDYPKIFCELGPYTTDPNPCPTLHITGHYRSKFDPPPGRSHVFALGPS